MRGAASDGRPYRDPSGTVGPYATRPPGLLWPRCLTAFRCTHPASPLDLLPRLNSAVHLCVSRQLPPEEPAPLAVSARWIMFQMEWRELHRPRFALRSSARRQFCRTFSRALARWDYLCRCDARAIPKASNASWMVIVGYDTAANGSGPAPDWVITFPVRVRMPNSLPAGISSKP